MAGTKDMNHAAPEDGLREPVGRLLELRQLFLHGIDESAGADEEIEGGGHRGESNDE